MINYKQIYDEIETTHDFIRVVNEYDQFQLEKHSFTWDYSTPPYTYLGNVGTSFNYEIPPQEERIGTQGAFNEIEKEIHEPLKYTHGYDRHPLDDWCKRVLEFLRFDPIAIESNVNVQRLNTVKVLHYDNMSTFVINNPSLHDLAWDNERRQPVHKWPLRRMFIALQDWQDGWMFQMGNNQWSGWQKGDVIDFHWRGQPHSTANASYNERAFMKVSGFTDIDYFGNVTVK